MIELEHKSTYLFVISGVLLKVWRSVKSVGNFFSVFNELLIRLIFLLHYVFVL
jgi:uncharacterized protein YqhQ